MESNASLDAKATLTRAVQSANSKRSSDCIQICNGLVEQYSESRNIEVERTVATAMFLIGQMYRSQKEWPAAIRWFEQAVDRFRGYDDPDIRDTVAACRSQLNWTRRPFLGRFGT